MQGFHSLFYPSCGELRGVFLLAREFFAGYYILFHTQHVDLFNTELTDYNECK